MFTVICLLLFVFVVLIYIQKRIVKIERKALTGQEEYKLLMKSKVSK